MKLLHIDSSVQGPASVTAGEHLETYLRWVSALIGVANPEFIAADGVRIGPEQHERALAGALQACAELAAA
jgi:FMN-dependent NADH-azoreductase